MAGDLIAVQFEGDLQMVSGSGLAAVLVDGKNASQSLGLSIEASACKNDKLQSPVILAK